MTSSSFGIIAPHPPIMVAEVGGADAEMTRASAFAMHEAARLLEAFAPDTLVIMSPHAPAVSNAFAVDASAAFAGDLAQFRASSVRIAAKGDPEFASRVLEEAAHASLPVVDRAAIGRLDPGWLDHGVLVPLSFLSRTPRWRLVVVSLSYLTYEEHVEFGELIARAAGSLGRRAAFLASGDCSHRLTADAPAGYSPRGKELDERIVRHVKEGDLVGLARIDPRVIGDGGECGLRSFITLGGFLGEAPVRFLHYEGPWGVGYLTAVGGTFLDEPEGAVTPLAGEKGGMPGSDASPVVVLARHAIEAYVRSRRVIAAEADSDLLASQAGAFVSLHRAGELRGCIGTIGPTQDNLAGEVVHNAIQAATSDPRFPPVTVDELDDLEVKVDVLHPPEPTTFEELDPRVYGVIVSADWRRGLLLPDLEGVDTPEQQVAIAMRKAGIRGGAAVTLERFKVDRYV